MLVFTGLGSTQCAWLPDDEVVAVGRLYDGRFACERVRSLLPETLPRVVPFWTGKASVALGKLLPMPRAVACVCCDAVKVDFALPSSFTQPLWSAV